MINRLTRRPDRNPHRKGWFVYCGDVRVGHRGKQAGVPLQGDQWGWNCGFYPGCDPGDQKGGTAASLRGSQGRKALLSGLVSKAMSCSVLLTRVRSRIF